MLPPGACQPGTRSQTRRPAAAYVANALTVETESEIVPESATRGSGTTALRIDFSNLARFARVATAAPAVQPRPPAAAAPTGDHIGLGLVRQDLLYLRAALSELADLLGATDTRAAAPLRVASSAPLALDNSSTPTVLQSHEEINTAPTSFSAFGPAWTDDSSAEITIGGVYDGSNGTGTLSFLSRENGVHGEDRLRIRVRDPGGSVQQNVTIEAADPLDQQYSLGNGLFLTLGAGSLSQNDTLTIDVFDTVGSAVISANPFNGVRNSNPNLDAGMSISAGSFALNGATITVAANDSVDSLLNQINESTAGVAASFDAVSERVVLTQNTLGSAAGIDFSSDTSGLLDVLKLSTAIAVPGRDPDLDRPLAEVLQFQAVASGTVRVNGADIAIDVESDSLAAVLVRINESQEAATAAFEDDPQRVALRATAINTDIDVDDGGTGFFAALNIASLQHRAERGASTSSASAAKIVQATERVAEKLASVFSQQGARAARGTIATEFDSVLSSLFAASGSTFDTGLGIQFAAERTDRLTINARDLSRALRFNTVAARNLLLGDPQQTGLIAALALSVDQAVGDLNEVIGTKSTLVDLYG